MVRELVVAKAAVQLGVPLPKPPLVTEVVRDLLVKEVLHRFTSFVWSHHPSLRGPRPLEGGKLRLLEL